MLDVVVDDDYDYTMMKRYSMFWYVAPSVVPSGGEMVTTFLEPLPHHQTYLPTFLPTRYLSNHQIRFSFQRVRESSSPSGVVLGGVLLVRSTTFLYR